MSCPAASQVESLWHWGLWQSRWWMWYTCLLPIPLEAGQGPKVSDYPMLICFFLSFVFPGIQKHTQQVSRPNSSLDFSKLVLLPVHCTLSLFPQPPCPNFSPPIPHCLTWASSEAEVHLSGHGIGIRSGSPLSTSSLQGDLAILIEGVGQCWWAFLRVFVLQVQQCACPQAKHSLF